MNKALSAILRDAGISPAEYAVLWHVQDTVVQPRYVIADWTARNLPNTGSSDLTFEDCLRSVDSLIHRGLLIELSAADIEADLARWKSEPLPVSWGVDRGRNPGDVDLTEHGFGLMDALTRQQFPNLERSPLMGYNDETPGLIRVFGETEESCKRQLQSVVERIDETPWHWPEASFEVEPMRPLGPWWHSRFARVPTGFEVVVRRIESASGGTRTLPRRHKTQMSRVALQSSRWVNGSLRPDTSVVVRADRPSDGKVLPRVRGSTC